MKTINISLPKDMLEAAKRTIKRKHYASMSELMRDALRKELKMQEITENGFTGEFEDEVLRSAAEPDIGVWETEEDVHRYFEKMRTKIRKKQKNVTSQIQSQV